MRISLSVLVLVTAMASPVSAAPGTAERAGPGSEDAVARRVAADRRHDGVAGSRAAHRCAGGGLGHHRRRHPAVWRRHARRCAAAGRQRQRRALQRRQLGDRDARVFGYHKQQAARDDRRPQRVHAALRRRVLGSAARAAARSRSHRDYPGARRHAVGTERRQRRHQHHHEARVGHAGRARARRHRIARAGASRCAIWRADQPAHELSRSTASAASSIRRSCRTARAPEKIAACVRPAGASTGILPARRVSPCRATSTAGGWDWPIAPTSRWTAAIWSSPTPSRSTPASPFRLLGYADREHRDVPRQSWENRTTYNVEGQHSIRLAPRYQLMWGGGVRSTLSRHETDRADFFRAGRSHASIRCTDSRRPKSPSRRSCPRPSARAASGRHSAASSCSPRCARNTRPAPTR